MCNLKSPATFDALLLLSTPGQFAKYNTADYMVNPFITERGDAECPSQTRTTH